MTKFVDVPYSEKEEQYVLGCMINSIYHLETCADRLKKEDFFLSQHKIIFQAICTLYLKDIEVSIKVLASYLESQDQLKAIGGIAYLTTLATVGGVSLDVNFYCNSIKNLTFQRKSLSLSSYLQQVASKKLQDRNGTLDEIHVKIAEMSEDNSKETTFSFKDLILNPDSDGLTYLEMIQQNQEKYKTDGLSHVKFDGVKTGFNSLDQVIQGFGNKNLTIIGARPGMGKTSLGLNILVNIAMGQKKKGAFFSFEMPCDQVKNNIVQIGTGIKVKDIIAGTIQSKEFQNIVEFINWYKENDLIFLDESGGSNVNHLKSRIRKLVRTKGVEFVVIDYLQKVKPSKSEEMRYLQVGEVSGELKELAKELNIAIIALAQLTREVAKKEDKKPGLADLKESGNLEQDADVVLLLHRPDYYDSSEQPGKAQIIVGKNRHGATGSIYLSFVGEITKFYDIL